MPQPVLVKIKKNEASGQLGSAASDISGNHDTVVDATSGGGSSGDASRKEGSNRAGEAEFDGACSSKATFAFLGSIRLVKKEQEEQRCAANELGVFAEDKGRGSSGIVLDISDQNTDTNEGCSSVVRAIPDSAASSDVTSTLSSGIRATNDLINFDLKNDGDPTNVAPFARERKNNHDKGGLDAVAYATSDSVAHVDTTFIQHDGIDESGKRNQRDVAKVDSKASNDDFSESKPESALAGSVLSPSEDANLLTESVSAAVTSEHAKPNESVAHHMYREPASLQLDLFPNRESSKCVKIDLKQWMIKNVALKFHAFNFSPASAMEQEKNLWLPSDVSNSKELRLYFEKQWSHLGFNIRVTESRLNDSKTKRILIIACNRHRKSRRKKEYANSDEKEEKSDVNKSIGKATDNDEKCPFHMKVYMDIECNRYFLRRAAPHCFACHLVKEKGVRDFKASNDDFNESKPENSVAASGLSPSEDANTLTETVSAAATSGHAKNPPQIRVGDNGCVGKMDNPKSLRKTDENQQSGILPHLPKATKTMEPNSGKEEELNSKEDEGIRKSRIDTMSDKVTPATHDQCNATETPHNHSLVGMHADGSPNAEERKSIKHEKAITATNVTQNAHRGKIACSATKPPASTVNHSVTGALPCVQGLPNPIRKAEVSRNENPKTDQGDWNKVTSELNEELLDAIVYEFRLEAKRFLEIGQNVPHGLLPHLMEEMKTDYGCGDEVITEKMVLNRCLAKNREELTGGTADEKVEVSESNAIVGLLIAHDRKTTSINNAKRNGFSRVGVQNWGSNGSSIGNGGQTHGHNQKTTQKHSVPIELVVNAINNTKRNDCSRVGFRSRESAGYAPDTVTAMRCHPTNPTITLQNKLGGPNRPGKRIQQDGRIVDSDSKRSRSNASTVQPRDKQVSFECLPYLMCPCKRKRTSASSSAQSQSLLDGNQFREYAMENQRRPAAIGNFGTVNVIPQITTYQSCPPCPSYAIDTSLREMVMKLFEQGKVVTPQKGLKCAHLLLEGLDLEEKVVIYVLLNNPQRGYWNSSMPTAPRVTSVHELKAYLSQYGLGILTEDWWICFLNRNAGYFISILTQINMESIQNHRLQSALNGDNGQARFAYENGTPTFGMTPQNNATFRELEPRPLIHQDILQHQNATYAHPAAGMSIPPVTTPRQVETHCVDSDEKGDAQVETVKNDSQESNGVTDSSTAAIRKRNDRGMKYAVSTTQMEDANGSSCTSTSRNTSNLHNSSVEQSPKAVDAGIKGRDHRSSEVNEHQMSSRERDDTHLAATQRGKAIELIDESTEQMCSKEDERSPKTIVVNNAIDEG